MTDRIIIRDGEVDTAEIAEYEATRRDAMRRGIAIGGTALAATTIPLLLRVRNAFAQDDEDTSGDAKIVEAAIGLEQTAVVVYGHAARSGLLDANTTKVAKLFGSQEQEHADDLTTALESMGGTAPPPPKANEIEGLAGLGSQTEVALFAIELETMAVAAYYDAHQKLQDAKLLQTGASIMANEGQHLVVLRQVLKKKQPVPNAFETGEK
jgi:ferritin-like protein